MEETGSLDDVDALLFEEVEKLFFTGE